MENVARVLAVVVGACLVLWTVGGAVKTVVLPRGSSSILARALFIWLRRLVFDPLASPKRSFAFRDRVMALYAPSALLLLPCVWIASVLFGFTLIFWGTGTNPLSEALATSGSSLLTLGFVRSVGTPRVLLEFAEAVIGLGLISLMISYLPTIYGAFGRREALVGLLESRAGTPPSPAEVLSRFSRIGALHRIDEDLFQSWEGWFADIEETHTSQPSLVFFRSPQPARSWITAAGCVLDTAALVCSLVDRPRDARAQLLLRTGFFSLRRIADFFDLPYDPDPAPTDPISVTRREFDLVCIELEAANVPLKADRDRAWRDFAGWRVNYDTVLLDLCALTMAPPGRWSSDRMPERRHRVRTVRHTMSRA